MTIKSGFIPCAGLGTRMGPYGRRCPKPLWPLFEKSLLEIQQIYLKSLGLENFFANTHHQFEKIETLNKHNKLGIKLLYEKELLGNGGDFHNLKKLYPNEKGVLVANPDVFLFLSKRDWRCFFEETNRSSNLILMPVSGSYNKVSVGKEGQFLKVEAPPEDGSSYFTYSGVSYVELSSMTHVSGVSSFFDTVINAETRPSQTFIPEDPYEYWDFGTLDLYLENLRKLFSLKSGLFWEFLVKNSIFLETSLDKNLYTSTTELFKLSAGEVSLREHKEDSFTLL
jgi:mannose-1-phosphate guanylyltransferase